VAIKDPTFPPVDPEAYRRMPVSDRLKVLTQFWTTNGFGSPKILHAIYLMKLFVWYVGVGVTLVTLTSGVGAPWDVGQWWDEPVIYQKLVLWTALMEVVGFGGAWGPLTGHFKPMTGAFRYWLKPGTLRMAPWPDTVPGTAGDTRKPLDVLLYVAYIVSLVVAIVLPGTDENALSALRPEMVGGVVSPLLMGLALVLLVLIGLRDKVVFLAARAEQYAPVLLLSAVLAVPDLIIAGKLLIVCVWVGAAVSKMNPHFENVVPPMVSNAPFTPTFLKKAHYRNAPDDLLPSRLAWFMAHVMGTTAELVVPLVLLFSTNFTLTVIAAMCMVVFHLFITSTFPLAVPLEWNVLFAFISVALFVGWPAGDGYSLFDFSQGWMLPVIAAALLFFPVLGNLRPDLVSFLPSMRQYAGNWASAVWMFRPGTEERLEELDLPVSTHKKQLIELGYPEPAANVSVETFVAWRSMHSQGRGLLSVLQDHLGPEFDSYQMREGETGANLILGWNFGDGHLHDERLLESVRRRISFAEGDFVVAWVESQPIHRKTQAYFVWDGAIGVVERGTWLVSDCVREQPWLPNGPVAHEVTWRHPERPRRRMTRQDQV
jgi:Transmembrane protein of unknown function (DUF3556)